MPQGGANETPGQRYRPPKETEGVGKDAEESEHLVVLWKPGNPPQGTRRREGGAENTVCRGER